MRAMKINERSLCAMSSATVFDLLGWLKKKSEMSKNWQRRYFGLKGNLLFYFEKKGDKDPLGLIITEGCTIELSEDFEQYSFQIVFDKSRIYNLCAETYEQMELWMRYLTCASYEYKKLMVFELQRQLNEVEDVEKKQTDCINHLIPSAWRDVRQNPFNKPHPLIGSSNIPSFLVKINLEETGNTNPSKCVDKVRDSSVKQRFPGQMFNQQRDPHLEYKPTVCLKCERKDLSFRAVHEDFAKLIKEDIKERQVKKDANELFICF